MPLQLQIDDEVHSEESDDNEDMKLDATASNSQDIDDGAPYISANTEAVGD
ncbi:hypothetical protein KIN20_005004 [Parelaphostrongylus tenuis]|uniref:Uncharacterized protein n=1 Tax=Parelaphostrongylus tenuis TaxID=148309 RepID=A0AAD5MHR3_PARTN|nr:hypothetical protein KIN20_005004 [Parelaphostrongylus tenuis]